MSRHSYFILSLLVVAGCGKIIENNGDDQIGLENLAFGSDATVEIMTWNLEWFPKAGGQTVEYVARILYYLQPDVTGLQEIGDSDSFFAIVDRLNELDDDTWEGYLANVPDDDFMMELAYIVNTSQVTVTTQPFEIYHSEGAAFPREPYILQFSVGDEDFTVINNHLKCCGNGTLDENNAWDDETRRQSACLLLDQYIRSNLSNDNVIVVGDLNDRLTDPAENNVFLNFLVSDNDYLFVDMDIAEGPSTNFSGPNWASHLDHILITSELFDEFEDANSAESVILVDDYLDGGWSEYYQYISDHRPVAWRFKP